jgi:hypothetical protein
MDALQDVREAQAHWNRVFSDKREPIKLRVSRRGEIVTELFGKIIHPLATIIRRPAYGSRVSVTRINR